MKVVDIIAKSDRTLISFEIIPPQRGGDIKGLLHTIETVAGYNPPFIDITSHSAEVFYNETPKGIQKKILRKRPGTLGICALIQNKYNIEAVPHVLARNFTREETEDFLIELNYLGIENVLAIQGDNKGYNKPIPQGRTTNIYASDLVSQIMDMNHGTYLEEDLLDAKPTGFCVGVSGYPEKHFEAPSIRTDMQYTKAKIDAGAEYIVTQMFFDNKVYFEYVENLRALGITAPIIPGLKILSHPHHLTNLPKNFFISLPDDLVQEVREAKNNEHVLEIGIEHTLKQVEGLLNANVPCIHFYIMQSSKAIRMLMERLKL